MKECCCVINEIAKDNNLRFKIGYTSTNVVKALGSNLTHQHAAVRKAAVEVGILSFSPSEIS